MIEISGNVEGEQLIRAILIARKRASFGSNADVLGIRAGSNPSPSVPQIAAKAGFTRLEILTGRSISDSPQLRYFDWQGIDGTQIDTSVLCTDNRVEPGTLNVAARAGVSPQIWYGELPALHDAAASLHESACLPVAQSLRESEFFAAITPLSTASYSLPELVAAIDTRGLKRPVLVVNNLSSYANEVAAIPLAPGEKPVTAIGPEGDSERVQILVDPYGDGINHALFVAKNVPLHGYAVWDFGATVSTAESDDEVTVSPTHLENASIRVEFDHATGLIVKIYDKDNDRDLLNETFEVQRNGKRDLLLGSCANLIELTAPGEAPTSVILLDAVEVIEAGPVRAAIRFTRTLPGGRSTIRQTIRLSSRGTRIDFATEIRWNEERRTLTFSFPVAINSRRAAYEIPFGYIERPTYWNDADKAESNETDGHNWIDLSEGDYGAALLNDGNYGCDVRGNRLRLHVPIQDSKGDVAHDEHRFTYSLLLHGGDLREGEVVENSCFVNSPPVCIPITGNRPGTLPLERSYFEVDSASVFIECIKRAENEDNAIIVRMYEAHNTRGIVLLTTQLAAKSAWLCDLLENNLVEIPLDNGEALLPFHPFEIITVKYHLVN